MTDFITTGAELMTAILLYRWEWDDNGSFFFFLYIPPRSNSDWPDF